MKCIDEEIPFEIPESWEWCRLNTILSKLTDGTHHSPENVPIGDYMYITAKNIKSDGILLKDITYVSKEVHDEIYTRCNPEKGDILYIKDGATTGIATINSLSEPFSMLSSVALLKPIKHLNNYYLLDFLQSPLCYNFTRNNMKGVGITRVTLTQMERWLIPIAPLKEQKCIVEQVDDLFSAVIDINRNKEELFDYIKNAKSKILDLAVRGKLVPQDPNDEPASVLLERIKAERPEGKKKAKSTSDNSHYTFDIPKAWEWTTIGDISEHNTGKTLDKGRNSGILYKYITTSNLYWDSFVLDNLKEMPFEENELDKCSAIKGDLLICEGGDGGRSAIWNKEYPICFQNHIHRVRPLSGIKSKYLYFFMLYSYLNGNINYYKKGIGIQSLSGSSLSSIKVPLPPIPEQDRIVKKIEDIFSSLDEIANSIKA